MSPDVRLAESANAFAQHHDGWEDAARAYAQLSEPLFIAGVVLLALTGLVLHRRSLVAASALAVIAAGVGLTVAAVIGRAVERSRDGGVRDRGRPAGSAGSVDSAGLDRGGGTGGQPRAGRGALSRRCACR